MAREHSEGQGHSLLTHRKLLMVEVQKCTTNSTMDDDMQPWLTANRHLSGKATTYSLFTSFGLVTWGGR